MEGADGLSRPGGGTLTRPRTLPEAYRRTPRTRSMSAMRRRTPRAGAQRVRPVCGETEQLEPRPRRPAPGGRQAAPRPGEGRRLRTQAVPPRDRRAHCRRNVHPVRQGAGRPRPRFLRTVPGDTPRGRPGQLCGGQGCRHALRRRQCGRQAPRRTRPKQQAPKGAPRGRPVHPLRPASARRGGYDLRAVPRQAPGGGTA